MSTRLPQYRLHKGSGQALVQINGEHIYLGKHGSQERQEKYRRVVAEWLASTRERERVPTPPSFPAASSAGDRSSIN